uniref:Selenoprotein K n=1 Tax=Ditylenchus dipsaci TaxID=166011 RepID=A0A915CXV3_9BILA
MVYVNKDGQVGGKKPFSITESFWNLIYFVIFFFRALLAPLLGQQTQYDPDSQARFRATLRGNTGGGGAAGGGGGPGRPQGGPRRPIGRLNTSGPSSMPSCPSGGCCR